MTVIAMDHTVDGFIRVAHVYGRSCLVINIGSSVDTQPHMFFFHF